MAESMKERLERLQRSTRAVRQPLTRDELDPRPSQKLITPESVYMRKVEKVMTRHANTKKKMLADTGQYLSLYHELKKLEEDFLALLDDPEIKFLDLPRVFVQKVNAMKARILNKKQ